MSKSSLYPVFDLYRTAVNCTPFLYRDSYTRRSHFRADSMDGTIVFPHPAGDLPVLTLRQDTNPKTGHPRMVADVVIYDLLHRPVWTGVFDYTDEQWESWELVRYANSTCRGDLMQNDNLIVHSRLNHLGHGACILYSSNNRKSRPSKWVGYDGVDSVGRLKYALLIMAPFTNRVTTPLLKYGVAPPVGTLIPLVTLFDSDYRPTVVGEHRPYKRMTWSYEASEREGVGGIRAVPLKDGTLVQSPRASDRTPRSRGYTPMQEAFYLVGEDYSAIKTGAYTRVDNNTIRSFYKAAEWVWTVTREDMPDQERLANAKERLAALALAVPERTINNVMSRYSDKFNPVLYCPVILDTLSVRVKATAPPTHAMLSDAEFFGT